MTRQTRLLLILSLTLLPLGIAPTQAQAQVQDSPAWHAQYWNTATLTGSPDAEREEAGINYDWGALSPMPGAVNADDFSARWTRTLYFDPATYRFTATSDDGIRVYVDGQLVLGDWDAHSRRTATADKYLAAGNHTVVVEYYELTGRAVAKLSWSAVSPDYNWQASYWNNADLGGSAVLTQEEGAIGYDWGYGSPADNVESDYFSAQWTRDTYLLAGSYRLMATSDDGMRVYFDGRLVIDDWGQHAARTVTADVKAQAGKHTLKVQYRDLNHLATARFSYVLLTVDSYTWDVSYWNNTTLSGTPALQRTEYQLDHAWGLSAPDPAIGADYFSVRWTSRPSLKAGVYRFSATADDGMRVYVDGQAIIDDWDAHQSTTPTSDVRLAAGAHTIVVEYYENNGNALARMSYARLP